LKRKGQPEKNQLKTHWNLNQGPPHSTLKGLTTEPPPSLLFAELNLGITLANLGFLKGVSVLLKSCKFSSGRSLS